VGLNLISALLRHTYSGLGIGLGVREQGPLNSSIRLCNSWRLVFFCFNFCLPYTNRTVNHV
jgi:hypothetical protein